MKIAWFTPFESPSAIGELSRHIVEQIALHRDVEVWISEETSAPYPTHVPMRRFRPDVVPDVLRDPDVMPVYNLGNSSHFHAAIMAMTSQVPGVVILHDAVMHHAYLDMARPDMDAFIDALHRWYGEDVAGHYRQDLLPASPDGYPPLVFASTYPLLKEAVANAVSVVIHADHQRLHLEGGWGGQVSRLHLPTLDVRYPPPPPRAPDGRVRLLSLGWVGETKQIHLVLEGLAAHPALAERFEYRVAGPWNPESVYGRRLQTIIDGADLAHCVTFDGYVDAADIAQTLAWADVHVNLRHPSTEGGSLSLLQQLATARPVLVSDSGIFGEVPDDAVARVDELTPGAVAEQLTRLADDDAVRAQIGARGRRWAEGHTVERYAREVIDLVDAAADERLLMTMADRTGDVLSAIGATPGMGVYDTVAFEMSRYLHGADSGSTAPADARSSSRHHT